MEVLDRDGFSLLANYDESSSIEASNAYEESNAYMEINSDDGEVDDDYEGYSFEKDNMNSVDGGDKEYVEE